MRGLRGQAPPRLRSMRPRLMQVAFAFGENGYALALIGDGRLVFTKAGVSAVVSGALIVTDTDWHHVAVTKSGSAFNFLCGWRRAGRSRI